MRVTRAIREYVEEEINKKYKPVIEEVGKDYFNRKEALLTRINAKINEYEKELQQMAAEEGFTVRGPYYGDRPGQIIKMGDDIWIKEEQEEINEECRRLRGRITEKTRQVLFDLEMGETAKAELVEVLDRLVAD